MAENTNIALQDEKGTLGKIEIAPEVLEIILGIAASKVEGVYQMRGTFASNVNELFGRVNHGKGVKLTVSGKTIAADVYVYLNYGVSVPKVALQMQEKVRQQLLYMTDLNLAEVNVHVVGVIPEKSATKIDPNHLFDEDDDEELN